MRQFHLSVHLSGISPGTLRGHLSKQRRDYRRDTPKTAGKRWYSGFHLSGSAERWLERCPQRAISPNPDAGFGDIGEMER